VTVIFFRAPRAASPDFFRDDPRRAATAAF